MLLADAIEATQISFRMLKDVRQPRLHKNTASVLRDGVQIRLQDRLRAGQQWLRRVFVFDGDTGIAVGGDQFHAEISGTWRHSRKQNLHLLSPAARRLLPPLFLWLDSAL